MRRRKNKAKNKTPAARQTHPVKKTRKALKPVVLFTDRMAQTNCLWHILTQADGFVKNNLCRIFNAPGGVVTAEKGSLVSDPFPDLEVLKLTWKTWNVCLKRFSRQRGVPSTHDAAASMSKEAVICVSDPGCFAVVWPVSSLDNHYYTQFFGKVNNFIKLSLFITPIQFQLWPIIQISFC